VVGQFDLESYRGCSRKPNGQKTLNRLLRVEMTRRGISYAELARRLASIGVQDTAVNLRNKVARGRFSAVFLVQCLRAIGPRGLRLNEDAIRNSSVARIEREVAEIGDVCRRRLRPFAMSRRASSTCS
jgi:hypothetical protein